MTYNREEDTRKHIANVQSKLEKIMVHLRHRINNHDRTKLQEPEKSIFNEFTPLLKKTTYGSDEYVAYLAAMKPALEHHYANNSHHPEHYPNGIPDMTLIDIIEMFCDWKAASERHADGNLIKSIEKNRERFNMSDELYNIFLNTAIGLGW